MFGVLSFDGFPFVSLAFFLYNTISIPSLLWLCWHNVFFHFFNSPVMFKVNVLYIAQNFVLLQFDSIQLLFVVIALFTLSNFILDLELDSFQELFSVCCFVFCSCTFPFLTSVPLFEYCVVVHLNLSVAFLPLPLCLVSFGSCSSCYILNFHKFTWK